MQKSPIRGTRSSVATRVRPSSSAKSASFPAAPGQIERYDCEYKRNGTTNLFIFLDAHRSWRKAKVTNSRAAVDFAACMRELIDVDFPEAERIRVFLDNLSTHFPGSLYQAFPPCEARRVLRRLEFHYVPKHASWLNIVEIEIGVLRSQCLDRRIATPEQLCPKSPPENGSAMLQEPASNGCSQPQRPAPKWAAPTPNRSAPNRPRPKSHNHCAEALVARFTGEVEDNLSIHSKASLYEAFPARSG